MKRKLSILLFSLMFSSVVFAEKTVTKTEYITEEEIEEKIVVAKIEKPKRITTDKKRRKWVCIVGPCDF